MLEQMFPIYRAAQCQANRWPPLKKRIFFYNYNIYCREAVCCFILQSKNCSFLLRAPDICPSFLLSKGTQEGEYFLLRFYNFILIRCQLGLNIKILEKLFFDCTIIGGATIVPRSLKTKRNKKFLKVFFYFLIINDSFKFANNIFSRI